GRLVIVGIRRRIVFQVYDRHREVVQVGFRRFNQATFPQLPRVSSPAAADHPEVRKAQYNGLSEISQYHADIPDRLEPADVAEPVFKFPDRDTKQVPCNTLSIDLGRRINAVNDVFAAHPQLTGTEVDVVLVVFLQLVQRVVRVEVFVVGIGTTGTGHEVVARDRRVVLQIGRAHV